MLYVSANSEGSNQSVNPCSLCLVPVDSLGPIHIVCDSKRSVCWAKYWVVAYALSQNFAAYIKSLHFIKNLLLNLLNGPGDI